MAEDEVDNVVAAQRTPTEQRYHDTCDRHEARGLHGIGTAESARALRSLGIEAHAVKLPWPKRGDSICYTTPAGVETLNMLGKAVSLANTSLIALARRLAQHPDVFGEFRAAYNLDADRDSLGDILRPLWKRPRVAAKKARRRAH